MKSILDRPSAICIFSPLKFLIMKKNLLKKIGKIFFPVLLFIALTSFIDKKVEPKTVTGEILDMKCYMTSGERGEGS